MNKLEIRKYQKGDEKAILHLFRIAFGKELTEKFWEWRYLNNPFYNSPMINLMWDENKLVGHYAVSPLELIHKEEVFLSALSMTTMTHPEYTGKGIFSTLAKDLYENIGDIEAVWGFPNLNSHYGFIKNLNWKDINVVPTLRLKNDFSKFKPADYHIKDTFEERHSVKLENVNLKRTSIKKNINYLNWRYLENPSNSYYIIELSENKEFNFVVIKVFNSFEINGFKETDILEHGYDDDPKVVSSIISAIVQFSQDQSIRLNSINTWMPIFDKRHLQLERNGFRLESPITIHSFLPLSQRSNELNINNKSWNLSMGDSDIY